MRQIKFRAWQKFHRRMLKVHSIDFDEKGNIVAVCTYSPKGTIPPLVNYAHYSDDYTLKIGDEDVLVLMQSTGLFDKNGAEIYEGDIASVTDQDGEYTCSDCGVGKVEYLKEFGFYNVSNIENSIHELIFQDYVVEVIGNIHDNPELMEEKK